MVINDVGSRIKELRKALNLTQKLFAERIGITQAHLSAVENNKDNPSESILRIIHNEFDTSFRWLRTGEGTMLLTPIDIEDLFFNMPEDQQPQSVVRSDLSYILKHPNYAVREEFRLLIGTFREIIGPTDRPVSGFDFLAIKELNKMLFTLNDCFTYCSQISDAIKSSIDAHEMVIDEDKYYASFGRISHNILDCKRRIAEQLDDYQSMIRDQVESR